MNKIKNTLVQYPFAVTLFVFFVFYFLPFKPKPFGDGEYHQGTIELIEFFLNGFEGNVRIEKGILTLVYYLIPYSLTYIFHNDSVFFHFGIFYNALVLGFSIRLLFKSFQLLEFSDNAKLAVILILNAFPIHIYYGMGILAETPVFFAVSLLVLQLTKMYKGSCSGRELTLLGVALLLIVGTRPNLLPFVVVFLIYFLFGKVTWKHKLIMVSGLGLTIFSLISLEKSISTQSEDFKSLIFRNQILWSRFELRDEPFNWLPQHKQDKFASKDYINNLKKRIELDSICESKKIDKTPYFLKWVVNDIIDHPLLTLRQYSLKFFQSQSFIISPLMKSDKSPFIKWSIHIYINTINYILVFSGLLAMYRLYRRKEFELFFPFLFFWGWSLMYVFIFHSEQRYMFPVRPILIFLLAYVVSKRLPKKFENHQ